MKAIITVRADVENIQEAQALLNTIKSEYATDVTGMVTDGLVADTPSNADITRFKL